MRARIENHINAIQDTVQYNPTRVVEISAKDVSGEASEKCPTCGKDTPPGAKECPSCGEAISPETAEAVEEQEPPKKTNWIFWSGLILVLMGGPGIAVGSWLHDLLKINFPSGYDSWSVFGWVNKLTAAVGIILLLVGMLVLAVSIMRERPVQDEEEM